MYLAFLLGLEHGIVHLLVLIKQQILVTRKKVKSVFNKTKDARLS